VKEAWEGGWGGAQPWADVIWPGASTFDVGDTTRDGLQLVLSNTNREIGDTKYTS